MGDVQPFKAGGNYTSYNRSPTPRLAVDNRLA